VCAGASWGWGRGSRLLAPQLGSSLPASSCLSDLDFGEGSRASGPAAGWGLESWH